MKWMVLMLLSVLVVPGVRAGDRRVYAHLDVNGRLHVAQTALRGRPLFGRCGVSSLADGAVPKSPPAWRRNLYNKVVAAAAGEYGLDPRLVHAVIQTESSYNASARSTVGAEGIMQLMPQTARSLGVTQRRDPVANIRGGTRYLAQLLQNFQGNVPLAVAAYNAGEGAVRRYGAVPPYAETRSYVQRVMARYQVAPAREPSDRRAEGCAAPVSPGVQALQWRAWVTQR